mmetsp:Transcript_35385/g.80841  ORF Transcript_35385/g.80841 Transcript_35385/m.80841 type:complete len:236 (+) Transcript_35385:37-744(+)|eukprot:CAMPEP_0114561276 /NCGR_PEP_ID=MMETSP0114-20121206/11916_1 /TAXON_ID=31324 /ORGANISM="Goniomonas sp, Strain m" /LENGTH=235 /DNA_ID=CAMNT_0001746897 /DNA_START=37 /DNA_END=744 /DNA_ORIENTATION=-
MEITSTFTVVGVHDPPINRVLGLIQSASEEIVLVMYKLAHDDVRLALLDALKRGVRIRAFVDGTENSKKSCDARALETAGASVLFSSGKMHAKFLVVDGKYALLGSLNYTKKGLKGNNHESILQTNNPEIVAQALSQAEELMARAIKEQEMHRARLAATAAQGVAAAGLPPAAAVAAGKEDVPCSSTAVPVQEFPAGRVERHGEEVPRQDALSGNGLQHSLSQPEATITGVPSET